MLVINRVGAHVRKDFAGDFEAYVKAVEGDARTRLHFVNAMVTHHTSFFRENHHFDDLRRNWVPRWHDALTRGMPIRVWSAACSSGQEPYSAAMVLHHELANLRGRAEVLATDISNSVLTQAKAGVYPLAQVRGLPPGYLERCFQRGTGSNQGHLRLRSEVRRMVRFSHLNLVASNATFPAECQAIFCRNVLIYFRPQHQHMLIASLSPGGTLYLGHSEAALGKHPSLVPLGGTIFRKVE